MKHVFIIDRRNRSPLVLSPFLARRNMDPGVVETGVEIAVSRVPQGTLLDLCLQNVYRDVDGYVSAWVADKRYIPRMLMSACVFLLVYFVTSVALRDPIPLVDEVLIGVVAAIFAWRAIARRDNSSLQITQTRLRLKQVISTADVVESSFVTAVEEYLESAAALDTLALSDRICGRSTVEAVGGGSDEPAGEFRAALEAWILLNDKRMARLLGMLRTAVTEKKKARLSSTLVHEALHYQLDLPLLSLVTALGEAENS